MKITIFYIFKEARSSSGWVLMVTLFYIWKVWYQNFPKPCRVSSYDIWLFFLNIVENAQNNTNFWFFCVTRKYRYRGDTQDVVWRRSIRFWEAQRSYFSSLKPLKWSSDPWVTFGQHLKPIISKGHSKKVFWFIHQIFF